MEKCCVIPVSGFFESHEYKGEKYPYFFKNEDESPMELGGLHSVVSVFQLTFYVLRIDRFIYNLGSCICRCRDDIIGYI